jgi:acyl dehydratase
MALDPRKLMALEFPEVRHAYGWRDTVLYALGLGLGADPIDPKQLRFVYEEGLEAMPTMANVLAHPGFWARDLDTGIDWKRIVHGEQAMRLHEPLPVQASVIGTTRIVDIVDKGADKGAIIDVERVIREATTGRPLATLLQSIFCRGDGGFGGTAVSKREPVKLPERPPDFTQDMPTQPQQALVYRLSGDLNPLHADPVIAHKAGFPQPILHGLATFGVAGRALMERLCDGEPTRVRALQGRFSAPVYPGETLSVDIWQDGPGRALFRVRVAAREVMAMGAGVFDYASA